ncbi:MAG: glycosyltransferase family protein [Novosphingobium sp.]|nr:glycosyltransferase family protein [Novosphingobium sp.]
MTAPARPRTVAILQARLSSSRLPGKVLMPLGGRPLIGFMIDRLKRASSLDALVLATSAESSDDALADAVAAMGVPVVRGPLDDVLARFMMAADATDAEVVVRLTGDCPLIDPQLVDRVVAKITSGECRYASNCVPATYPDGLDCEAFTVEMLRRCAAEATLPSQREHVTPWIRETLGDEIGSVTCSVDLSSLRWTIDYEDDLMHVRSLVQELDDAALTADLFDLLRAHDRIGLKSPEHARNEGYATSLEND